MWWSGYSLVFIAANVYVFIRLRTTCPSPVLRKLLIPFFLLLVAAFPAAEMLSHNVGWGQDKMILMAGYCVLPYILYLFLGVLVMDFLLVLNRIARVVPESTVHGPKARAIRFGVLLALPLAVIAAGRINYVHIKVNEYAISVPRRSSSLDHLRIIMAADFHLGRLTDRHFMERFLAKANALEPDIVLIPGDIFEGDRPQEWSEELEAQFRRLKSKYGVFACYGNHESHQRRDLSFFFRNAGIRVLLDEVVAVDGLFYVAGRKDSHGDDRARLSSILQGRKADLPLILMDHRPEAYAFKEASRDGVDICFSGHTHDGQLFPVNWYTAMQYPLSWGHKKIGGTDFFVTCGIQAWGPPIKTAGCSEIMLVDVTFAK